MTLRKPLLVSFSGLDGSGKSTQIANLVRALHASGYRTKQLAFWDDVVVGTKYREGFVHKAYKSERGIGAPGKPVERRDKNVRRWYLTIARHLLYFADAVHLRFVVGSARRTGADVVIVDRYIYDELANLPLSSDITRAFAKFMNWMAPRPDVAYLLDADPEAARARKPEYPVDFMRECRRSYKNLAMLLGGITIIPPLELEAAKAAVLRAFEHKATLRPSAQTASEAQPAA
jgi:thymidylate kinase